MLVTHGSHAEGRASNRKFDRGHAANVLRAPCLALVSLGTLFQKQRHQLHSNRRRACPAQRGCVKVTLPSPSRYPPGTLSPVSVRVWVCMPHGAAHTHRTLPAPTHTPARPGLHIAAAHTSAEEHVEIVWRSHFRRGACGDLIEIRLPWRSMWRRSSRSARAEARWPRSPASPR